jgi:hypothetical protein
MFRTLYNISTYLAVSMPVLAVVGIATIFLGSVRIGTGLFLCGAAAFLLGIGGIMGCGVWALGFRSEKGQPVHSALYATFYGIFSAVLVFAGLGLFTVAVWRYFIR